MALHPDEPKPPSAESIVSAEAAIRTLLAERDADSTICPSEAARLMVGEASGWRAHMPLVHEAAQKLAREEQAVLMRGGQRIAVPRGAYRIGRPQR